MNNFQKIIKKKNTEKKVEAKENTHFRSVEKKKFRK